MRQEALVVPPGTIDVHAHYFPRDAPPSEVIAGFPRAPRLVIDSPETGRLVRGTDDFRTVRRALWDVPARLADMDRAGVAVQAISPVPVMLEYGAPAAPFAGYCRWVNESVARAVEDGDGRLVGIGTVPLGSPPECVAELRYLSEVLGLRGIEIGTRIDGMELDDTALEYFFDAVDGLGLAVLVHPVDGGGGAVRRSGFTYDFGLGMPSDTALAATALVFGGVLDRHRGLRIAMVHGCGTFPWAYPRLRLGAQIAGTHTPEELDLLVSRLYADTLVFDAAHLPALVHRFGPNRVLLGSDHPFIPGQPEGGLTDLDSAAEHLPPGAVPRILRDNALEFLGLSSGELVTDHFSPIKEDHYGTH
ncbi:amidohydrolase family protein [Rhodococcus sp. 4CII]|uniref:amidohydrolase family protein n=1 Tax=Rhodococcus sp. 4CII TaxID=2834580 RepID=UPI001BB3EFAF|nr:amidohydrolase family protein [Rhodococcus sp. 4CII]